MPLVRKIKVPSITELFNGFNTNGTYSGGPTVISDNLGVLQTSPANVLPITGGRLSGGVWLPTTAAGAQIWPSTPVRTRSGSVAKYDSTYLGALIEPARTNKVTARKHNPTDTTNVTKSGDAAAVLSVVDDTAALTSAGLISICTNGKVYKLDNSAGVGGATATVTGQVTNTNAHSLSVFVRIGAAVAGNVLFLSGGEGQTALTGSGYTKFKSENVVPGAATRQLAIQAGIGGVIYFILPQLEEGAFATSTIPGDTLAAVTRPASNYTRLTSGKIRSNNFAVWLRAVPSATGQATVNLWSAYFDANYKTEIYVNATQVRFYKVVDGDFAGPVATYTHAAAVPFEVQVYQSTTGMGIRVKQDGGSWGAWIETTDATSLLDIVVPATYQIGAMNNANHVAAGMPFVATIYGGKTELERLAERYP